MLKVKHLTFFKPKNWKKAGIFTKVKKNRAQLKFFLQPSVALILDFN